MAERQPLSEYVERWGNSASIALLDPRCQIFTDPRVEGAIAYLVEGKHAVAFGDPVCSPENIPHLAGAFHEYSKANAHDLIYLTASEGFARWAMQNGCQSLLEVEEELVIDPADYPRKGSNGRLLHKKMNHAKKAGVEVKEFVGNDPALKSKIIEAEASWLRGRRGPQIYMSRLDFFDDPRGRRCFYAVQGNRVVGSVFLSRLEAQQGWVLYLLATIPEAPGGTSEYLILSTLDQLAAEGCHFFSFGVAATEKMGDIVGLGAVSSWLARLGFKVAKKIFPLDNRRSFWKKFEPRNNRSFILFSQPHIRLQGIRAILKTVNASL